MLRSRTAHALSATVARAETSPGKPVPALQDAIREHLELSSPLVRYGISAGLLLLDLRCLAGTGRRFASLDEDRRLMLVERLRDTRLPLVPEVLRLFRYLGILALQEEAREATA